MTESSFAARRSSGGEMLGKRWLVAFAGALVALLIAIGFSVPAALAEGETVFTVNYTVNGGDSIVAKEYTRADLEGLAKTGSLGYMFSKGDTTTVNGVTQYVAIDDLLGDALGKQKGVYWNESSTLSVTCSDGEYTKGPWGDGGMSYSTFADLNENGKFFPATTAAAKSTEGAVSTPVVLSLKSGSEALADEMNAGDALKTAAERAAEESRIFVGVTEEDYKAGSMAGNRFPSDVVAITVNYTTPDFTVKWTLDGEDVGSKTYKSTDLDALKTTSTTGLGYIQYKGDAFTSVKATTEYVTVDNLLKDALGDNLSTYWKEGSQLSVTCSDGEYTKGPWGDGGMSYSTFADLNENGKFFPSTTASTVSTSDSEDSPIVVALKFASADMKGDTSAGTARDDAVKAAALDVPTVFVGVTEEGMKDPSNNAAGNRFPSGVTEITVNARSKYDVKFETNGGSAIETQSGYFGDKIEDPGEPTREGYTFDGWFTDKELKTALDVETFTIPKGGATIYAKWTEDEPTPVATVAMHRLYNPNSGEHFYTSDDEEYEKLVGLGWHDEGIGWTAPETSNTPVYRLYNEIGGEHHYTMKESERDDLVKAGWNNEGIGWYSDDAEGQVLYREYNPNEFANNHNYTTNKEEHDNLIGLGWRDEGTAWYGVKTS